MANPAIAPGTTAPRGNVTRPGKGKGKRQSREERGLPPLTGAQTLAKAHVQQAQNACVYIKQHIDKGNMPTGEVLQACSTLTGALAGMLVE